MNIDDADLIKLKVYQIEKFLTGVLIRVKHQKNDLMLNPSNFQTIIYDEYINSLREWRSLYNSNKIKINPNPFFPKYDIDIKDYQEYHGYVMSFVEELIYHNINRDKIILRDVIDYLKETDLRKNDNFVLYNTLSKIQRQYQVYILNQVSLATYETKDRDGCIDAFVQLFQDNTYKGFVRYRMRGLNSPNLVNYHKLLTENISKDEMTGIINNCMMRFNLKHNYQFVPTKELFANYIDNLIYHYSKQILDQMIKSEVENKGIEKTVEDINQYMVTKDTHIFVEGDSVDSNIKRYLLKKHVKPSFIKGLLVGKMTVDNFDLTFEEVLNNYVNNVLNINEKGVKK